MPRRGAGHGASEGVGAPATDALARPGADRGVGRPVPPGVRVTAVWEQVATSARLEIEESPDAEPLDDARVAAAVAAVLHEAADRARSSVLVEVGSDGSVRVHDDGGPRPRRLGVLACTARDALRDLGADLHEGPSDRLEGSVVRIDRPGGPSRG